MVGIALEEITDLLLGQTDILAVLLQTEFVFGLQGFLDLGLGRPGLWQGSAGNALDIFGVDELFFCHNNLSEL